MCGFSQVEAVAIYSFSMTTSPVTGLIMGGYIKDKLKNKSLDATIILLIKILVFGQCFTNVMTYIKIPIL